MVFAKEDAWLSQTEDAPLTIDDFKIEPDDGIFVVGIEELPLTIAGRRSKDIIVGFRPRAEVTYRADLSFSSNQNAVVDPVLLLGTGFLVVCLPCDAAGTRMCTRWSNVFGLRAYHVYQL